MVEDIGVPPSVVLLPDPPTSAGTTTPYHRTHPQDWARLAGPTPGGDRPDVSCGPRPTAGGGPCFSEVIRREPDLHASTTLDRRRGRSPDRRPRDGRAARCMVRQRDVAADPARGLGELDQHGPRGPDRRRRTVLGSD